MISVRRAWGLQAYQVCAFFCQIRTFIFGASRFSSPYCPCAGCAWHLLQDTFSAYLFTAVPGLSEKTVGRKREDAASAPTADAPVSSFGPLLAYCGPSL